MIVVIIHAGDSISILSPFKHFVYTTVGTNFLHFYTFNGRVIYACSTSMYHEWELEDNPFFLIHDLLIDGPSLILE